MKVKAVFCSVQDVGKLVKKTKKHFVWKFSIGGKDHILELFASMLSGKKKLKVDGRVVFEAQKILSQSFTYQLDIGNQMLNIYQNGEKFELLINNQPFSHLYDDRSGHHYDDVTSSSDYRSAKTSTNRNKFGAINKKGTLRANQGSEDFGGYPKEENDHYHYERENDLGSGRHARNHHRRDDDEYEYEQERGHWDSHREAHSQGHRSYNRENSFEKHQNKYSDHYRVNNRAKTDIVKTNNHFEESKNRQQERVQNGKQNGFDGFENFSKDTFKFDEKENVFPDYYNKPSTQPQAKRTFFDADPVESIVVPQSQQRTTLDTTAQQNLFVFGTTREEQSVSSTPTRQQQQQWQNQQQLWQTQQQTQPQQATTVVENGLLDLASESETKANQLSELYKQNPQQTQVQLQPQSQPQPEPTTEIDLLGSEPPKKDLWKTNLVNLNVNDLKKGPISPKEPAFINYNIPSQPNGTIYSFNNMNQNVPNMNMNMNTVNYNMNGFSGMVTYPTQGF